MSDTDLDLVGQHSIKWSFSGLLGLQPEVVCTSPPDAFCRSAPANIDECTCEEVYNVGRDDQGWYHLVESFDDEDNETTVMHRHSPAAECNTATWMNADPIDTILETCRRGASFEIGTTPITTEWNASGYDWKPISEK